MILICFDGSDDARAAIARAGEILSGQPATVLTVWEPFGEVLTRSALGMVPMVPAEVDTERVDAASREQAEQLADEGAGLARSAGLDAHPRIAAQRVTVPETILAEAEAVNAAAIVMGSRGLTGLRSLLVGSVSHGVIQHADRMVIVVPSPKVAAERARRAQEH